MSFLKRPLYIFLLSLGLSYITVAAELHFIRDPFSPPLTGITQLSSEGAKPVYNTQAIIKLTGIIWDEKAPFAMFETSDGKKTVNKEDSILGWTISSVQRDKVLLKRNSKTLIVKVGKEVAL